MAQFTTRRGTILETTSIDINVEQSHSAALRRTGTTVEASVENSGSQTLVVALSQSSDFSLFDDFNLSPKADDVARRSAGRRGTPEPAAIDIAVPASANERAALLIENDGVFTWHFPSEETPSRRGGRREVADLPTLTFRIPIGAAPSTSKPDGRRGLFDTVFGDLFQPIKAYVFKFAARHAVGPGSRWLERNVKPGGIVIQSDDITTWRATSPLPETTVTSPKAKRILLFIHGTFSSTLGSFGALALTPEGKAFIKAAKSHYDVILAFDHRTLSEWPEQNAEAILEALSQLKTLPGAELDIVAFSRGGLIARLIAERVFARGDSPLRVKKVVFIGCTNSGTALANPENWKTFLDLYTNLAVVAGRGLALFGAVGVGIILEESVKTLADFVRALVEVSVTDELVPGLAAMAPKGALVADLNASTSKIPAATAEYFAIGSDFESGEGAHGASPLPQRLVRAIADMNLDSLMGAANDLVVDNPSMTSFGPMKEWLKDSLLWKANANIFHTNYFAQASTSLALQQWLIEGRASLPAELRESDRSSAVSPQAGRRRSATPDDSLVARQRADRDLEDSLELSRPKADKTGSHSSPDVRCYFTAEMAQINPLGRPADLAVTISREDLSKILSSTVASDSGPVKPDELIRVEVRAQSNCRVAGNHVLDVRVPAARKPDEYKFAVEGLVVGPAEVWIDASQGGSRIVRVVLQPKFIAQTEIIRTEAKGSAQAPEGGMVELRIIEESANNDKYRLRFILQSADLAIGPINLVQDINREKDKIVADFYHQLEGAWGNGAEFETFMDQIRTYGANIYSEVIPRPIKDALWVCRERIGCIQVFSGEPSIPWEILFTVDDTGSIADDGKFLGELGLIRWLDNTHWPPSRLSVRPGRGFFVIPDYVDPRWQLKGASAEAAMLKEYFGAMAVGGSRSDVLARLDKGGSEIDLIHFACHGSASEDKIWNAALLMAGNQREDGTYARETLSINDIKYRARLRRENSDLPLVFVNACQAGKMGRTISGTGGIADAFISKGAGLFVSSLWSIGDDIAHTFANEFYKQLIEGATVVQATSSARSKARDVAEPTWLAYAVYGHPYARLSVSKGQ